jgi:hypothetical protein
MSDNFTSTTNGAVSLKTTGNDIINFFMMMSRGINYNVIKKYMKKCWIIDPVKTVAIIFNSRDRVSGKKEKKISNLAMFWLRCNKPETYKLNILNYINKYGCWKDLTYISYISYFKKNLVNYELKLIADQLKIDKNNLDNENDNISLCAKWASSENDRNDKRRNMAKKIANYIFPEYGDNKIMEKYRKQFLTPLRKKIKIVETKMCNNEWNTINYQAVPAAASNRYKKCFMKHDEERYKKFIEDVKSGKKKINTTGLLPHDLVRYYMDLKDNSMNRYYLNEEATVEKYEVNDTIEVMWNKIVEDVTKSGNIEGLIPVSDVSGSMYCNNNIPILVSISLGLLISQCNKGAFNNKIIAFSEKPQLFNVEGTTLFERFNSILKMDAGLGTNFEAVSDLILNHAKKYNVPQEHMVKKIIVLSDMQFNQASSKNSNIETLHDYIVSKYTACDYKAPDFIYWNLNSHDKTFPVESTKEGTAIVSGFSEQLLKAFMYYDNISPEIIVDDVLQKYICDVIIDNMEKYNNNFSDDEEEDNTNTTRQENNNLFSHFCKNKSCDNCDDDNDDYN